MDGVTIDSSAIARGKAIIEDKHVDLEQIKAQFVARIEDLKTRWTTTKGVETTTKIENFINSLEDNGYQGYINYIKKTIEILSEVEEKTREIENN